MTDHKTEADLATRLIAEDHPGARPSRNDLLQEIIDNEQRFERRVRRTAIWAWSLTFATLPILGLAMFWVDTGAGLSVEVARWVIAVVGTAAMLALLGALLATVAWLFRSRSASLAAIDGRLAALERILLER